MPPIAGLLCATALTAAAAIGLAQPASPPQPASAPPVTARPIHYGAGWNAVKCASAKTQGQTVSKHDCPDIPAAPVPPKG